MMFTFSVAKPLISMALLDIASEYMGINSRYLGTESGVDTWRRSLDTRGWTLEMDSG